MLTGTLGIRLVLLVGAIVPLPAPAALTSVIEQIEVTNSINSPSGFQITFRVSKNLLGEYDLLSPWSPVALIPNTRVIICVIVGLLPQVLIDGIITHHQLQPSPQPGQATLTVSGTDLTALLNITEQSLYYPQMPYFAIVESVISKYSAYGIVAVPGIEEEGEATISIGQQETDLSFLLKLGYISGNIFYIEPVEPGVSKAYFGADVRVTDVQPALTMAMGASGNLLALNFSQDYTRPVVMFGALSVPESPAIIPYAVPAVRVPPLAAIPTVPTRFRTLRDSVKYDAAQTMTTLAGIQNQRLDSVTAAGEVDTMRYGSVIKIRRLIGVRGAGYTYDGLYWVNSVTHVIERNKYTQSFSLSREGVGSTTPVVMP